MSPAETKDGKEYIKQRRLREEWTDAMLREDPRIARRKKCFQIDFDGSFDPVYRRELYNIISD